MSKKTTHTPGPWMVGPEYEDKHARSVWCGSFAAHAHTVARYIDSDASARLIAAAPDLLAAAKMCVINCGPAFSMGVATPDMIALRVAVAKAEQVQEVTT